MSQPGAGQAKALCREIEIKNPHPSSPGQISVPMHICGSETRKVYSAPLMWQLVIPHWDYLAHKW